ncbi:MAG: ATP-binding protein, partial [Halanaerobiaceae bacterium]
FDIIIMIMIFWIFWLVGGISDLERKLQDFFKKTAKERARSLRIISALVSRLQETNQELKKSQKLFRLNFEKAGIGIAICRPDGSIIKANSALGKMLGFSQDKLKDIKLAELARKDETKLNSTLNTLLSGPESHTVLKMKYYNRSGKPIWVKQNLTLARENGQPSYFLIHVEDITEKKQAEMEIKTQREKLEYNRLKTRFFSRMSHELKTPLNLIFTSMHMLDNNRKKLLQNNRETEKMFDKYLGILEQNSYRLLRLINNVIDLTKIDSKSFDIEPVNCNLSSLTAKVINSVRKYVESKNRRLQYDCNSEKIITACDPASIERIILNLLSNAIKFTEEGDKIKVTLTKKNNLIKLHVSDTGIGIEKEKQDIIFDHFRQVDESFTRQEEGSGTGLPLVKSLVELHKGNIEVVSTYGKGSVFTITLPQKILPHTSTKDYLPSDNLINKYNLEFADLPG